ncbi:MAG: SpoIVB peptidase [Bacilli bacterium]|nr:SpoIVB peptidase [Bacilli bacterium]
MKKRMLILLLLSLFPLKVSAYSKYIIPGGETLGIDVKSDGIMVIGFYKVAGKYNKGTTELKSGDYILEVNNNKVYSVDDLTKEIEDNVNDSSVTLTFKRKDKIKTTELSLIEANGIYKTGLYVKDNITGIGTLSYVDPETKIFGALGHEIVESNSNSIVEIRTGTIFKNEITSIDKSVNGSPGSKNAKFEYQTVFGNIFKNTNYGIYGSYIAPIPEKELIEVAEKEEVKVGNAKIYTVLEGNKIETFDIEIKTINEKSKIKNMTFEIIDKDLVDKTGGVVQGMSGSPIIQNDKIIGAVTHVVIDNVTNGYGIFITTMLEEGER